MFDFNDNCFVSASALLAFARQSKSSKLGIKANHDALRKRFSVLTVLASTAFGFNLTLNFTVNSYAPYL